MSDILRTVSTRSTPQTRAADPRQALNAAGGYTFQVDDEARLRRFLLLGTDGGTYYAGAEDHTMKNFDVLVRMADTDPRRLVDIIVDISTRGAAPKQNPALFALAYASAYGDPGYALSKLPEVARTGTHLFLFAGYVEQFRGWGRGLRRAIAGWYTGKTPDELAYQAVKYRNRNGWTHRDLLRLSHPTTSDDSLRSVFQWIITNTAGDTAPALIGTFLAAQEPGADVPALIRRGDGLSWEMLPDTALADPKVWDALLERGIPQTALLRQLPRLTRLGLLPQVGGWTSSVAARIADPERLRRARVHPLNVLVAQRTYASGVSLRGSSEWRPTRIIVDALDAAFYAAYGAVEPAMKRTLIGLDISGSMGFSTIGGLPLTPREASAAMALVTMATEPDSAVVGFSNRLIPLSISPRQRLDDVMRDITGLPFGGTDCSLPPRWALKQQLEFDTFMVITDNETWSGLQHPHQALQEYRDKTGIPAKLVVVGTTATECSIANPSDPGMLDIAGFDTAVPQLVADFSRGA
jgi:60 kDa SS-A/Ro ribonucleoprotein